MKFEVKDINKFVIASDTDSIFINMEPILQKRYPDLDLSNQEETIEKIKIIKPEFEITLNKYQDILAKNILNSDRHYFDLKSESIIKKAYWSGKRRYAQHIVNKEGREVDELVLMGLDIMKSNMVPLYKNFGKEILMDIMYGKKKEDIDVKIINFRKYLKTLTYKQMAKPTGVKKIKEYIASPPSKSEIFSKLATKCPINTKAAIYTNDLLRYHKLDKEYTCFTEGDKMYYINLKQNPYKISVIGFNGVNDPPFLIDFITKFADLDLGFESVLLNKLQGIYSDLSWTFPSLNENVGKFFKF